MPPQASIAYEDIDSDDILDQPRRRSWIVEICRDSLTFALSTSDFSVQSGVLHVRMTPTVQKTVAPASASRFAIDTVLPR